MSSAISFAGAALLASAFLFSHFGRASTPKIKGRWQALSAGVTVAYVFLNILPELEVHRPTVAASATASALLDAEKKVYLWTLSGFVTFVALTRLPLQFHPHGGRLSRLPYRCEMT